MYINHRLISYSEQYLLKDLFQKMNIRTAQINKLNRYQDSTEIKSSETALIDFTEDYFINEIIYNSSKINKDIINKIRDNLWKMFNEKNSIVYESKFFHKGIAEKVFTKEQLEKIKEFKIKSSLDIINVLTPTFNKPKQTIPEFVFLIAEYQIKVDDVNKGNLCDKLYNYLLNNFDENNNMYAKEYIIHYTAYLTAKDLNVPMPYVYMSDYGLVNEKIADNSAGISTGNSGMIVLHRQLIKNNVSGYKHIPSIIFFMQAVAHEIRHSNQAYRMEQGENSLMAFDYARAVIFRTYLSDKDYNEYKENYWHSEIESDAEQYSWHFLCKIIKSRILDDNYYLSKVISATESTSYSDLLGIKSERDKNKLETYEYNVKKMNELVLKMPELLTKYPQLKLIYNFSGKVKDIFALLENEYSKKSDKNELAKIYNDYYLYFISNGDLEKFDPLKLAKNSQTLLFDKLADLVIDEMEKLNTTLKVYDKYNDNSKGEFDFVSIKRTKRIKLLINYLKKYKVLTAKLENEIANTETLEKKLSAIDKKLDEFQNEYYQAIFQGIYDSSAHQHIESLKEVIYNEGNSNKGRK